MLEKKNRTTKKERDIYRLDAHRKEESTQKKSNLYIYNVSPLTYILMGIQTDICNYKKNEDNHDCPWPWQTTAISTYSVCVTRVYKKIILLYHSNHVKTGMTTFIKTKFKNRYSKIYDDKTIISCKNIWSNV